MTTFLSFIKAKKLFAIIIGIVIVAVGAFLLLRPTNKNSVYTVGRDTIVNTLLINGTYTTASQTPVNSPADGIITKLYVKNGDQVKKNDPLFYVESTATEEEKAAAYANYLTASSALGTDKAALFSLQSTMFSAWKVYTDIAENSTYQNSDSSPNTSNRVLTPFTTAQDDWLAAEASYKNQQTVIAKDQAALTSAQLASNATQSITVNAPAVGTVVNFQKQIGDQVQSVQTAIAAQTQSGQSTNVIPPVLVISDLSNPVLTASVDQVNIPRINIGQTVSIVFDALPNETFAGVVHSLDTVGTKTQGTTDYNVGIEVPDVSPDVMPNMTASATVEIARRENVLTVPNKAIVEKNGKPYVQKAGASATNLTLVEVGLQGLTKTEVIRGLSAGDKIRVPN